MPTEKEREYYRLGFLDGLRAGEDPYGERGISPVDLSGLPTEQMVRKSRKRTLSKWQRFVKANAKKPRFKYKSGKKKGMVNLRALGIAYRKKRR
tara:strand:- start:142 stop:423 length:282 start_codon:yes stop_codon:yes gene_type:complete